MVNCPPLKMTTMKFEVSATLAYEAVGSSSLLLTIQPFPSKEQTILSESFLTTPALTMQELFSPSNEKRVKVLEVAEAGTFTIHYTGKVANEIKEIPGEELADVFIPLMPASVLPYLNPSRYCQSDKLYKFAFNKFGAMEHAFDKVNAICDWIHRNIEYSAGFSTSQTSAFDTITEQVGVCRDFAHLGVALCRALTIPARYFSGYAYKLNPPDFHACFEAYLGGHWIIFDATRLVPLNGLVKVATGLDAAETAIASSFGNLNLQTIEVKITSLDADFQPISPTVSSHGYSYS